LLGVHSRCGLRTHAVTVFRDPLSEGFGVGLVTLPTDRSFHLTLRPVCRYGFCVIKSFVDKRTAAIFAGYMVRDLPLQIQKRARAKLIAIDAAKRLDDLRIPPGNRLETLHSYHEGQHSIRINDQWRICFVWRDGESWDVEFVDYRGARP
jgi:toxin HigB-1